MFKAVWLFLRGSIVTWVLRDHCSLASSPSSRDVKKRQILRIFFFLLSFLFIFFFLFSSSSLFSFLSHLLSHLKVACLVGWLVAWLVGCLHTWYLSFFSRTHFKSWKFYTLRQNCQKQYFSGSSGIFLHSAKKFTRTAFTAFMTNIRYGCLVGCLVGWLVGCLVGGLVGCLLGWLGGKGNGSKAPLSDPSLICSALQNQEEGLKH